MSKLRIVVTIGAESEPDELAAVKEAFKTTEVDVLVNANYMRMSADWQQLPMTILINAAQGIPSKILWEVLKIAYKKIVKDKRMQKRKPTFVISRTHHRLIIGHGIYRADSSEETIQFNNFEDLIEFDKQQSKQKPDKT